MVIRNDLKGIRGWLILVALQVIITPIMFGFDLVSYYFSILADGSFVYLTNSSGEGYFPEWAALLGIDVAINAVLLLFSLYVCYLFFTRHYRFPVFFIGMLLLTAGLFLGSSYVISWVFPQESFWDNDAQKQVIKLYISMAIWIPYMCRSKRVHATFIER